MRIKESIFVLIGAVILTCLVTFAGKIVMGYIDSQNAKFNAAVAVVEKQMYQNMLQAQKEHNLHKARYYFYQMQNADKLVIELGADFILANKKTR